MNTNEQNLHYRIWNKKTKKMVYSNKRSTIRPTTGMFLERAEHDKKAIEANLDKDLILMWSIMDKDTRGRIEPYDIHSTIVFDGDIIVDLKCFWVFIVEPAKGGYRAKPTNYSVLKTRNLRYTPMCPEDVTQSQDLKDCLIQGKYQFAVYNGGMIKIIGNIYEDIELFNKITTDIKKIEGKPLYRLMFI